MSYRIYFVTRTALLLFVTLLIQFVPLPTVIKPPLVNMMLFLAIIMMGPISGLLIGLLTPWTALKAGYLSIILEPAIPSIILGNVALIAIFSFIYQRNFSYRLHAFIAVLSGALAKYLVIHLFFYYNLKFKIPSATLLQYPQLFYALVGGFLALIMTVILKQLGVKELLNLNWNQ